VLTGSYIRYVDDRSINIKHYKCYDYNSNVLMKISVRQNINKMKHATRTSYNSLAFRSGPYWFLNFMNLAMENCPSLLNTSDKMNFAISNCSVLISMSNSLSWLYFLRYHSKKMVSKEESVDRFVELLTDINKIGIIHTKLSASVNFVPI
jgi:hypothetical protein